MGASFIFSFALVLAADNLTKYRRFHLPPDQNQIMHNIELKTPQLTLEEVH